MALSFGEAGEPQPRGAGSCLGEPGDANAVELCNRLRFNKLLLMCLQRLGSNVHAVDFLGALQSELACLAEAVGFERCVFWQGQGDVLRIVARFESVAARMPPLSDMATRERVPLLFAGEENGSFNWAVEVGVVRCAASKCVTASDAPRVVLLVECREHTPGCDFLYADALCLMCELVGGVILHAADSVDLSSLRKRLIQADRVARMGQLTATLAHELNQPLAATLCNAQAAVRLLAQEPPDVKEARSALGDIVESARHAGTVIRQTRALIKGGLLCRQSIILNRVVKSVIVLMQGDLLLAGAALKAHLDETLPPVFGDETQLQQVVRNLLVNACDAVREKPTQERVIDIHTGLDRSGLVELCVQDSGIGILSGMEDKIFELYYTTKSEGQGMGLPICQQIVKSHGGNIVAERLVNGGTSFRITLPPYAGEEAR